MRWLLVSTSLGLILACSDGVGTSSSPIVGGDADTQTRGVVMLYTPGNGTYALCTASVISPHVLVTAGHCVDPAQLAPVGGLSHMQVLVADDLATKTNADLYAVRTTASAPGYSIDTIFVQGHDVGVVVTTDALPVTPIPYARSPLDPGLVGAAVRLVGYGATIPGNYDSIGVRESGTTTIAKLEAIDVMTADALPSGCEGDSGGPALVSLNGVETIVGVISHGTVIDSCKSSSFADRVDVDSAFVDSYVNQYDPGFLDSTEAGAEAGDAEVDAPAAASGCTSAPGSPSRGAGAAWLALALVALTRARREI